MKKLISCLLAAAMLGTLAAGCSQEEAAQSAAGGTSQSAGASEPAGEEMEPVTYVIMLNQAIAEYPPDGGEAKQILQKAWEEDLGITNTDYEVILASGDDYNTKLNAMMSGGDVPDYFHTSITDLQNLVDNEIIVPVDSYVENMPSYQALLEIPGNVEGYDNFILGDSHYAITEMSLEGVLNGPGRRSMIMRTDWLESCGLEVPATLDELHDVLYAFTFEDPDGNGQDDTYGLSGNKGQYFSSIFGAFGIYLDGINSWAEVNGELVHSTVLPGTKEALEVLNKWYAEGLIDPDKFVVEGKQAKDKFIAGKFGAWENTVWWANDARVAWEGSGTSAECAFITPVSGPDGKHGYPVNPIKTNGYVISKNCADTKDIDRFVKILDWTCDDGENGGLKLVEYGIEGEHYTYDAKNDVIDQSLIGDAANLYKLGYSNPVRWVPMMDNRWIAKNDPREIDLGVSNNMDNWLSTEFSGSVQAMKDYPDLFSKLWDEYFTKIITGDLPVDAFEQYVEDFYDQGGTVLTEQVNEAWSEMKNK